MSHHASRNLFLPLDNQDGSKSPALMSPGVKTPGFKSPGIKSPGLLKSPMQGLFLNKFNGSSTSVNEMPHTPNGIRAQLGHLLPKHAYFHARVVIHQIQSVPYVGGEFGVRWKFKGVQVQHSGHKQGLLDRVKGRADARRTISSDSRVKEDVMSPGSPSEEAHVNVVSPGGSRSDVSGTTNSVDNTSMPPVARANTFSSMSSSISSQASSTANASQVSTEWGALSSNHSATASHTSVSTTIPTPIAKSNSGASTPDAIPLNSTPSRGMTPFLPLKDHSVVWGQTLDTTLKFDIDRETSLILPNPLKLVVMQRVNPGDPYGNPQNPRLGAVYLNLAEYVGQGSVERRYLLKESKTNATLKARNLTIELEHISGETHYVAPPLAKGEILTGLVGFLEKDVVKKRPRALDLYGPYKNQEELETDILADLKSPARPRTARSLRHVSEHAEHSETETEDESHDHSHYHDTTSLEEGDSQSMGSGGSDPSKTGVAFDVQRLPVAYGTKTTEMLIEALFNPVKVSDKKEESPFTVYEPSSPKSHKSHHSSSSSSPFHPSTARPLGSGEQPMGLGLTGIPETEGDKTATIGRRQNSTATDISSSWTTATTSDSASDRSSGASKSRNRSRQTRSAGSHSLGSGGGMVVVARSTPEGRVVVEHHPRNASNASNSTLPQNVDSGPSNAGGATGVRGWWKRIAKPSPSTSTARTATHA